MFTFIHIFGLNFLVKICSAVFWMRMDLNLSFRCSIRVNAFSCDAIIKVLCAQPRFRPLTRISQRIRRLSSDTQQDASIQLTMFFVAAMYKCCLVLEKSCLCASQSATAL